MPLIRCCLSLTDFSLLPLFLSYCCLLLYAAVLPCCLLPPVAVFTWCCLSPLLPLTCCCLPSTVASHLLLFLVLLLLLTRVCNALLSLTYCCPRYCCFPSPAGFSRTAAFLTRWLLSYCCFLLPAVACRIAAVAHALLPLTCRCF